jgi:two-component system chemotaxis response regulator CheY
MLINRRVTIGEPSPRTQLLVADDDAITRRLLQVSLEKAGYDVELASDGLQALAALERAGGPRLALLDGQMPGLDGDEVCRRLRSRDKEQPYVYLLLLTAAAGRDRRVAGLDAGADDYLGKPFDPAELLARLRAGERVLAAHDELLQSHAALRLQATSDPLTGLLNHGGILATLEAEVVRASRSHAPLALIIADVDRFKQVNDTHGHPAGDAVLREAANLMRAALRQHDFLGRYGGDELIAVLPGCTFAAAALVAERLREAVTAAPIAAGGAQVQITLSLGVASWADETGAGLIARADAALYRAKAAGRNRAELAGRPG